MANCHFCGCQLPDTLEIQRSTTCPSCDKDLKICLNCAFYAPGSHWDCRETIPEPVREKDRANFCDYFSAAREKKAAPGANAHGNARAKFDNLFDNG